MTVDNQSYTEVLGLDSRNYIFNMINDKICDFNFVIYVLLGLGAYFLSLKIDTNFNIYANPLQSRQFKNF